jgi:hypothetical protein
MILIYVSLMLHRCSSLAMVSAIVRALKVRGYLAEQPRNLSATQRDQHG